MEIDTAERKQMLWNSNKSNKQKLINLEASIRAKSCLQGNNIAQERTSQLTSTSKSFEWPHNTLEVSEVSRTEYISSLVVVVVWMSWVLRNLLPRPRARIRKPAFRRSRDGPTTEFWKFLLSLQSTPWDKRYDQQQSTDVRFDNISVDVSWVNQSSDSLVRVTEIPSNDRLSLG